VATDIGTLPGDNFAEGGGINDTGQIVGQSCSATTCSVFLWQNGVMTDLNVVIPAGSSLHPIMAHGINSRGEIAGWAFQNATGLIHAFLAIPCDDERADDKGCDDQSTSAAQEETRQTPHIVIPENVHKLLRGRHGFQYPGFGVRPQR
jgi:probable HAF family extracellular repeat protein